MSEHLSIEGKTPTEIQVSEDRIVFVCGDEAFVSYHMQDCCESVSIHDISGDLQSLVGQKITESSQDEVSGEWPGDVAVPPYMPESYTWTTQVFCSDGVRVSVRWLGESNGYYGEGVYFQQTHVPVSLETA